MKNLERELSDIKTERESRLEAVSANRAALRSRINRICETFRRILHEDTTLAERIRTLFRKQGMTIVSILTAVGMAISTLVLALTGGGGVCPPRHHIPTHPTRAIWKSGWKNTSRPLGVPWLIYLARLLQPCLGSLALNVVSWLLNTLGKTATWLAENCGPWPLLWEPYFSWQLGTG